MKKKFLTLGMGIAILTMTAACNTETKNATSDTVSTNVAMENPTMTETGVEVGGAMMVPSKNIVENAMASNDHTTLVAAVKQAELVETLSGAGPFTVFAPTNEAFAKIPKATLDGLMKPEMKADLAKILTYHVVSGAFNAADLKDGQELTTAQGGKLKVTIKDGVVMINDAKVTIADALSSNGVTHVIDAVLMPK